MAAPTAPLPMMERIEPSRLDRAALVRACKERGLTAEGSNVDLIRRVTEWQDIHLPAPVVSDDDDDSADGLGLDDTDEPIDVRDYASPPGTPVSVGVDAVAKAPAAAPAKLRKTGMHPGGYRSEFTIGWRDIDDGLHFTLLEKAHEVAREAGYRTKGAPFAGTRTGFSKTKTGERTAIYEVAVHKEDQE